MEGSEKPLTVLSVSRDERWSGIVLNDLESVCAVFEYLAKRPDIVNDRDEDVKEREILRPESMKKVVAGIRESVGRGYGFSSVWRISGQRLDVNATQIGDVYLLEMLVSWKQDDPDYVLLPDALEQTLAYELRLTRGLRSVDVGVELQPDGDGFLIDLVTLLAPLMFLPKCMRHAEVLKDMTPRGWSSGRPVRLCYTKTGYQLTLSFENLGPRYDEGNNELWKYPQPAVVTGPVKSAKRGSLFIFARPRVVFTVENMVGRPHCRDPILEVATIEDMIKMANEIEDVFAE